MDSDTKRILLQVLETILEQQGEIGELRHKQALMHEAITESNSHFDEDLAEVAAWVPVRIGDSAGLVDRIARLSQQVRSLTPSA